MKKTLKKGMLALGILMVAFFGVGGSALAGYPTQHSIERSMVVEPMGYPTQHSIEIAPVVVQPLGYPTQH